MSAGEEPADGQLDIVSDDELLWRRVPAGRYDPAKDDPTRAVPRRQDAFRSRPEEDGLSVDRAKFYVESGGVEAFLFRLDAADESWGVLEVSAAAVRGLEGFDVRYDVRPDPIAENKPDGPNPAHALIVPKTGKNPSRRITEQARWAYEPTMRPPDDPGPVGARA